MDPFIWLLVPCFNIFSVTKLLRTFVSEREYKPWRILFISILTETERI